MSFRGLLHRMAGFGGLSMALTGLTFAANCDLNSDGFVNVVDVQLITNQELGTATCAANIAGLNVCTDAVRTVVINAALGGQCHSVSLSWTASTSSNVAGYNIYRSASSSGPFTKLNTSVVTATSFIDTTALAGQTYYYEASTVDTLNNESPLTSPVSVTVPTP